MRNIRVKVSNDKERDAVLKNFGELGCKWIGGQDAMEFKPIQEYPYYLVRYDGRIEYGLIGYCEQENCRTIPAERFMKDMKKITIVSDGKTVTATDENGRKGIAKCSPEDKFSIGYGAKLAIERLDEIKAGDEVVVTDTGKCYRLFATFFGIYGIDSDTAALYCYGACVPDKLNGRVLGVHPHPDNNDTIAVVEQINKYGRGSVYLVSTEGLKRV